MSNLIQVLFKNFIAGQFVEVEKLFQRNPDWIALGFFISFDAAIALAVYMLLARKKYYPFEYNRPKLFIHLALLIVLAITWFCLMAYMINAG
ncbi:MAG: hypothetical protein JWM96_1175 [Alphaproteobacteria bacterium]|nr:hypothetical protein [Alphaproteobacteria bacterium]